MPTAPPTIDELQRQIEALEEAVRARDDFIAIAAHELRSPLGAIALSVQYLRLASARAGAGRPAALDETLEALERNVQHFVRRASTLLDVTRLSSGSFPLEIETVDLSALALRVAASFAPELEAARCALRLDLDEGVTGRWDRLALDQVLMNLMSNAVKFGAGQPVELTLRADAASARVSVADRGPGVSDEARQRMFQKFERAVRRSEYGGFGIGLWIARQLVEGLGGTIEVENRPGGGSVFSVCLPRQRE